MKPSATSPTSPTTSSISSAELSKAKPWSIPRPPSPACAATRTAMSPPSSAPSSSSACIPSSLVLPVTAMGLSDFPAPFIVGVRPWTSRHGLRRHPPQAKLGSPGSRARCFRTCPGSVTAQGPVAPRDIGAPSVAFRILLRRRHPEVISFRGSIPGPHVPLSTLHPRPRGRRRMTRGRRGSLTLRRMTLSFTTTLPVFAGAQEVKMILKDAA